MFLLLAESTLLFPLSSVLSSLLTPFFSITLSYSLAVPHRYPKVFYKVLRKMAKTVVRSDALEAGAIHVKWLRRGAWIFDDGVHPSVVRLATQGDADFQFVWPLAYVALLQVHGLLELGRKALSGRRKCWWEVQRGCLVPQELQ